MLRPIEVKIERPKNSHCDRGHKSYRNIQLLHSRGIILVPQAPEAFDPLGSTYFFGFAEAEVKKGQRTAIVTGVISVLLGIGYLVLIQLLDTRGIILVPPPPEASILEGFRPEAM